MLGKTDALADARLRLFPSWFGKNARAPPNHQRKRCILSRGSTSRTDGTATAVAGRRRRRWRASSWCALGVESEETIYLDFGVGHVPGHDDAPPETGDRERVTDP